MESTWKACPSNDLVVAPSPLFDTVVNIKVIFDWAPFCSGPLSVGEMLRTVMHEEEEVRWKRYAGSAHELLLSRELLSRGFFRDTATVIFAHLWFYLKSVCDSSESHV